MASAAYSATNNNWSFTQTSNTTGDYILFNNTKCGIRATIASAAGAVSNITFELAPGEAQWYKASTAGTLTVTGVPIHTAIGATEVHEDGEHSNVIGVTNGVGTPGTNSGRLVLGPF